MGNIRVNIIYTLRLPFTFHWGSHYPLIYSCKYVCKCHNNFLSTFWIWIEKLMTGVPAMIFLFLWCWDLVRLESFIDQVDLFLNWQGQRISNEHVFDDFSWKIRMSPQTAWMNINYFSIGHSKLRSSTYFFIRYFLHCIIISSRFSSSCNKLLNWIFISLINLPRWKLCIAVASKVFPLQQRLHYFPSRSWLVEPPSMIFALERRYAAPFSSSISPIGKNTD